MVTCEHFPFLFLHRRLHPFRHHRLLSLTLPLQYLRRRISNRHLLTRLPVSKSLQLKWMMKVITMTCLEEKRLSLTPVSLLLFHYLNLILIRASEKRPDVAELSAWVSCYSCSSLNATLLKSNLFQSGGLIHSCIASSTGTAD